MLNLQWNYLNPREPILEELAMEINGYVRIDECRTCRRYLKSVDQRQQGAAVPLVDERATVELDLWAREAGTHEDPDQHPGPLKKPPHGLWTRAPNPGGPGRLLRARPECDLRRF